MIEHFYRSLPGQFTWPDFYAWLPTQVQPNARIVEIGTYAGQSAACLGVELLNYCEGKNWPLDVHPVLDLVDVFDADQILATRRRLAPIARALGAVHGCGSVPASGFYPDRFLDAVFIDGDHAYPSVIADIDAWLPKVRPGGILAGHDYTPEIPDVVRAVHDRFDRFEVWRGERFRGTHGELKEPGGYFPVWCVRVPG